MASLGVPIGHVSVPGTRWGIHSTLGGWCQVLSGHPKAVGEKSQVLYEGPLAPGVGGGPRHWGPIALCGAPIAQGEGSQALGG